MSDILDWKQNNTNKKNLSKESTKTDKACKNSLHGAQQSQRIPHEPIKQPSKKSKTWLGYLKNPKTVNSQDLRRL